MRYFTELFRLSFLYSKCRRGEKISGTSLHSAYDDERVSILLRPKEISRICDSSDGREIPASQCDKFVRESLPKKATGNLSFFCDSFVSFSCYSGLCVRVHIDRSLAVVGIIVSYFKHECLCLTTFPHFFSGFRIATTTRESKITTF